MKLFCVKCGKKIESFDEFCLNCGAKIKNSVKNEKIEEINLKEKIYFRIKPIYSFWYHVFNPSFFYSIFLVLFVSLIMSRSIEKSTGFIIYFSIIFIILIFITAIKVIIDRVRYKNIEFVFYKDRVIYRDNFWTISEKELKYKNIKEITFYQNYIGRKLNLGVISIFTNASNMQSNNYHGNYINANGLCIHCVYDVETIYKKIKNLIDENDL